jgi:hypothetical protein
LEAFVRIFLGDELMRISPENVVKCEIKMSPTPMRKAFHEFLNEQKDCLTNWEENNWSYFYAADSKTAQKLVTDFEAHYIINKLKAEND